MQLLILERQTKSEWYATSDRKSYETFQHYNDSIFDTAPVSQTHRYYIKITWGNASRDALQERQLSDIVFQGSQPSDIVFQENEQAPPSYEQLFK